MCWEWNLCILGHPQTSGVHEVRKSWAMCIMTLLGKGKPNYLFENSLQCFIPSPVLFPSSFLRSAKRILLSISLKWSLVHGWLKNPCLVVHESNLNRLYLKNAHFLLYFQWGSSATGSIQSAQGIRDNRQVQRVCRSLQQVSTCGCHRNWGFNKGRVAIYHKEIKVIICR